MTSFETVNFESVKTFVIVISFIITLFNFIYSIIYKEFLLNSKLHGKILYLVAVSLDMQFNYDNFGEFQEIKGLGYILKLSLVVSNKTFNIKKVRVIFYYSNLNEVIEAKIFINKEYPITMLDQVHQRIVIPASEHLALMTTLEKDQNYVCYLPLISERFNELESQKIKDNLDMLAPIDPDKANQILQSAIWFSKMEILLYDFEDQCLKLSLDRKDIDPKLAYYDETLMK